MNRYDGRLQEARDRFLSDTKDHRITVLEEGAGMRRVRVQTVTDDGPTWVLGFEVTTWPGYLAITGDMGHYVFKRLPDMFEFFRQGGGGINPGYWHEKVVAADDRLPAEEFDMETLRQAVRENFDHDHVRRDKALAALDHVPHGFEWEEEKAAVEALHDFDQDAHEMGRRVWTHNFLWLLHAIVLAIKLYDEAKVATKVPVSSP